jgi:hypothetical protein
MHIVINTLNSKYHAISKSNHSYTPWETIVKKAGLDDFHWFTGTT